jgi:elongation factor Ts
VRAAAQAKDGEALDGVEVDGEAIEAQRAALVGRLGENVTVRRWTRVSVEQGLVHAYIHMGGKIGAIVGLSLDSQAGNELVKEFADNVAMQIAAMAPAYLVPSEVPASDRQKQAEIFDTQLREEGKPDAVRPKLIEGKVLKWMKDVCLLEQASILDSEKTVAQKLAELSKAVGGPVALTSFARYECGEGIEKKKDDFAAEAQRMAQG